MSLPLIEKMKPNFSERNSLTIWDEDKFQEICKDISVINENVRINVKEIKESSEDIEPAISTKHTCSVCILVFPDYHKQKIHFKSELHCINLKRKVNGKGPLKSEDVNESEYEESEESSSSESEQELDPIEFSNREPLIIFQNATGLRFSTYKCLILTRKEFLPESEFIISRLKQLPTFTNWSIILLSAGHFAAAIFNKNTVLEHKTFHRYVTRRKQGSSQSSHDQHSGHHAKSAGASLRRQQETALIDDISSLIQKWLPLMEKCSHIFYRACGGSKRILFSGKKPILLKRDTRLRRIPFATKRPSYDEVIRTHTKLSIIENIDASDFKGNTPRNFRKQYLPSKSQKEKSILAAVRDEDPVEGSKIRSKKSEKLRCQKNPSLDDSSTSDSEEYDYILEMKEEILMTDTLKTLQIKIPKKPNDDIRSHIRVSSPSQLQVNDDLYTACKVNDLETLKTITASVPNIAKVLNTPIGQNVTTTCLHIASQGGFTELVWLLMESGADPTIKNSKNQLPYNVATNKESRNTFTKFMGKFPDKFNYAEAQIPPPLSEEVEKLKALKKQKQRQEKRVRSKENKMAQEDKLRFMALTDYEKKVWCGQKSNKARCFQCSELIAKTPFEYNGYICCSVKCVTEHRSKKPTLK